MAKYQQMLSHRVLILWNESGMNSFPAATCEFQRLNTIYWWFGDYFFLNFDETQLIFYVQTTREPLAAKYNGRGPVEQWKLIYQVIFESLWFDRHAQRNTISIKIGARCWIMKKRTLNMNTAELINNQMAQPSKTGYIFFCVFGFRRTMYSIAN